MSATQILIDVCVLCSTGCFCFALGISLGERLERRSAHEAWGAPGKQPVGLVDYIGTRNDAQRAVLESIRAEFEYPRPRSCAGRSRVSVDREGIAHWDTLESLLGGRFPGAREP